MADLIFRGVKNPANCSECFFWPVCPCLADFDDYSAILDAVHDGNLVRHEKCPLVPLPAEHGRLIDAEELRKAMYHEAFETDSHMQKWESGCWIRYRMFERNLETVPTIVPAEGGTDNG